MTNIRRHATSPANNGTALSFGRRSLLPRSGSSALIVAAAIPPLPVTTTATSVSASTSASQMPASPTSPTSPSSKTRVVEKRKILEIGCNWGGKTTILKGMKYLFAQGFCELERTTFKDIVFSNILYSMKILLEQSLQYTKLTQEDRKLMREHGARILEPSSDFQVFDSKLLSCAQKLWSLEPIRRAYAERNRHFHIPEIEHWMNDIERLMSKTYVPTEHDVMLSRVKTTGIVSSLFNDNNYEIQVFDVGSERNERKKWYSCFERVTDLFYVVGIDEFDMLCYEDNFTNRLSESLSVWKDVINSQLHFKDTNIFLVLNKADLFAKKVTSGTSDIRKQFPNFKGDHLNPRSVLQYMIKKFLTVVPRHKKVHICVTNALDMDVMAKFWKAILTIPPLKVNHLASHTRYAKSKDFAVHEEWAWKMSYQTMPVTIIDCMAEPILSTSDLLHYTDFTISVPEKQHNMFLHVHSFVIATKCPKFFEMLKSYNKTTSSGLNISVVPNMSYLQLKNIISYIYTGLPYPFADPEDSVFDPVAFEALNEVYEFSNAANMDPSKIKSPEKKKKKKLIRTPKVIKDVSKAIKQAIKSNTTKRPSLKIEIPRHTDSASHVPMSPFDSEQARHFQRAFYNLNMSGLESWEGFSKVEQPEMPYDLEVNVEGKIIKAHKFVLANVLPAFYTASQSSNQKQCTYIVPPLLKYKSCELMIQYLYGDMSQFQQEQEEELFQNLELEDVVDMICFSKMCLFGEAEDEKIARILTKKLQALMSVNNVISTYDHFQNDYIDFSKYIRDIEKTDIASDKRISKRSEKALMFYQQTRLFSLPVEILLNIYTFIAAPYKGKKKSSLSGSLGLDGDFITPKEEHVLSQDELSFLLFVPFEFAQYLKKNFSEFLVWKTERTDFSLLRSVCLKFSKDHIEEILESSAYRTMTQEQQKYFREQLEHYKTTSPSAQDISSTPSSSITTPLSPVTRVFSPTTPI